MSVLMFLSSRHLRLYTQEIFDNLKLLNYIANVLPIRFVSYEVIYQLVLTMLHQFIESQRWKAYTRDVGRAILQLETISRERNHFINT